MKRISALIPICLIFLCVSTFFAALAQISMTTIVASSIKDAGGNALARGTIAFLPVDNKGNPMSSMGIISRPVACFVVAGAITTQVTGATCQIADALAANPNVCYRVSLYDSINHTPIPTPGQLCAQPTGSSWSYDTYVPALTSASLVTSGPAGPAGPACSTGSGTCNMTVPIFLPSNPTSGLEAATKQYVDAQVLGVQSLDSAADVSVAINALSNQTAQLTASRSLTANTTLAAGAVIDFKAGGILSCGSWTLTLNGTITGDLGQHFDSTCVAGTNLFLNTTTQLYQGIWFSLLDPAAGLHSICYGLPQSLLFPGTQLLDHNYGANPGETTVRLDGYPSPSYTHTSFDCRAAVSAINPGQVYSDAFPAIGNSGGGALGGFTTNPNFSFGGDVGSAQSARSSGIIWGYPATAYTLSTTAITGCSTPPCITLTTAFAPAAASNQTLTLARFPTSIGIDSTTMTVTARTSTSITGTFNGTGVWSATYSSGTVAGSGLVLLSNFNGSCAGTTAQMAVSSGSAGAITMLTPGSACASAPTTASCTSVSATCTSSTITLTSTLAAATNASATEAGLLSFPGRLRSLDDCSGTASSTTLTCPDLAATVEDVGAQVRVVYGAGSTDFLWDASYFPLLIASVTDSTHVVLSAPFPNTVFGATVQIIPPGSAMVQVAGNTGNSANGFTKTVHDHFLDAGGNSMTGNIWNTVCAWFGNWEHPFQQGSHPLDNVLLQGCDRAMVLPGATGNPATEVMFTKVNTGTDGLMPNTPRIGLDLTWGPVAGGSWTFGNCNTLTTCWLAGANHYSSNSAWIVQGFVVDKIAVNTIGGLNNNIGGPPMGPMMVLGSSVKAIWRPVYDELEGKVFGSLSYMVPPQAAIQIGTPPKTDATLGCANATNSTTITATDSPFGLRDEGDLIYVPACGATAGASITAQIVSVADANHVVVNATVGTASSQSGYWGGGGPANAEIDANNFYANANTLSDVHLANPFAYSANTEPAPWGGWANAALAAVPFAYSSGASITGTGSAVCPVAFTDGTGTGGNGQILVSGGAVTPALVFVTTFGQGYSNNAGGLPTHGTIGTCAVSGGTVTVSGTVAMSGGHASGFAFTIDPRAVNSLASFNGGGSVPIPPLPAGVTKYQGATGSGLAYYHAPLGIGGQTPGSWLWWGNIDGVDGTTVRIGAQAGGNLFFGDGTGRSGMVAMTPTYSPIVYVSGASACPTGSALVVTFTAPSGVTPALGTIAASAGVPTRNVTVTSSGLNYTIMPTTGTIAGCTGTATFSGGYLVNASGSYSFVYNPALSYSPELQWPGTLYPNELLSNVLGLNGGAPLTTSYGSQGGIASSGDPGTTANVPMVGDGAHGQQAWATGPLGSMAAQNAGSVTITGGTIDGSAIGGTTPAAGSFTTLSASSTVNGVGFSNYLASPPAIGGTTPAAGSFTTLSANSFPTPGVLWHSVCSIFTGGDAICGHAGDNSISGVTCGNASVDALNSSPQAFVAVCSIPANYLTSVGGIARHLRVVAQFGNWTPVTGTAPSMGNITLGYGTNGLYTLPASLNFSGNLTNQAGQSTWEVWSGPQSGGNSRLSTTVSMQVGQQTAANSHNNVAQPTVALATNATVNLFLKAGWASTGVGIPTYASGGTPTGTGSCLLAASGGGGSGAQLTMNVVSGAFSSFAVTNTGNAYTSEPTSWTYVSGSACSTTVTTTGGTLGGAQGTAMNLISLGVESN